MNNIKTLKTFFSPDKVASFILYFSILAFIIAFNFSDNPKSGWYQQFIPDLHGGSIVDLTFTDSLTGYAVTSVDDSSISYILKTLNGGENWIIIKSDSGIGNYTKCQFINNTTGFISALDARLLKTSDGGTSWILLNNPTSFTGYQDICVLSESEVWMCFDDPFTGGVYRTTNSGINWENKYPPQLSNGPTKIYMINSRIGFISNGNESRDYFKLTNNSGDNWFNIINGSGWEEMIFKDSLTGYKTLFNSRDCFKGTTNGGLNWDTIINASIGNPNLAIINFDVLKDSIIFGVYYDGYFTFPNGQHRYVIYKTTNNGVNWGFQIPDTSIRSIYNFVDFPDSLHGWSYSSRFNGVHTITGGDTITYPLTDIYSHSSLLPVNFILNQNYPNPFNPNTIISYELRVTSFVKLKVFTVQGKEIKTLVDQKQGAGEYKIDFDAHELPSGVYFYTMLADGMLIDTKKMILIR